MVTEGAAETGTAVVTETGTAVAAETGTAVVSRVLGPIGLFLGALTLSDTPLRNEAPYEGPPEVKNVPPVAAHSGGEQASPTTVELNEAFANVLDERNRQLASDLTQIEKYEPRLYEAIGGKVSPETALKLAKIAYGRALEKMVAEAIADNFALNQYFEYQGGANNPDFVGKGPLEGLSFDITTESDLQRHIDKRQYGENLVVHPYSRPKSVGF
jgi:hypothetical protein